MMREKINSRYIELCKAFGVTIAITNINTIDAPDYEICTNDDANTITLNDAKIDFSEYDTLLGYIVSLLLLPRLVLKTERLVIRRFRMDDAVACFDFMSDEQGTYMDCCKTFYTMDDEYWEQMKLFEQREGQYVIILQSTNEVIGSINVFVDNSRVVESREIGYGISPKYQRNGYAFEAVSAILNLLQKDLLIDMVVAGVLPENIPSIKLLEKLGFKREGIRHKAHWHEGLNKPVDLAYYYIDR